MFSQAFRASGGGATAGLSGFNLSDCGGWQAARHVARHDPRDGTWQVVASRGKEHVLIVNKSMIIIRVLIHIQFLNKPTKGDILIY